MVVAVAAVLTLQYRLEYGVCGMRRGQSRLYWRFFGGRRFVDGRVSENALEMSLQSAQCKNPFNM